MSSLVRHRARGRPCDRRRSDEPAGGTDEPAVLVAGPQESAQLLGGAVAIDGEHRSIDGARHHAIPSRRGTGEFERLRERNGTVAREQARLPRRSQSCQHRHRHLHLRGDATQVASRVGGVVGGGSAAQQEVGEHVGAQLVHRPPSGFARAVLSVVVGSREAATVAGSVRPTFGRADLVSDRAQSIADSVGQHRRKIRQDARHAVVEIVHDHAPTAACALMALMERFRVRVLGQRPRSRSELCGRHVDSQGECPRLEPFARRIVDHGGARLEDGGDVCAADFSCAPRGQRRGEQVRQ